MFYFSHQFNQKGSISSSDVKDSSIFRDVGFVHPSQHSPHAFLSKPYQQQSRNTGFID